MRAFSERERIQRNVSGETPPPVEVRMECDVGTDVHDALLRVREVMTFVASRRMLEWPDDAWWKSRLPSWFLCSFEGHSIDDILEDPSLWDFGSWLDAMKSPGWEWWSSSMGVAMYTIWVSTSVQPYSIEPLCYLCRVAGADAVSLSEGM